MMKTPVNYPEMIIERPVGENESERFLMKMCDKSFLRLWTWRNLHFVDKKINKELCDVLVVFRNIIIIFSDKYIKFGDYDKNEAKTIETAWKRWYKKAVTLSVKQIFGAERNLRNNPENIYLDKECSKKFPSTINIDENTKIFRVAVAHGAGDACQDFFNGGSGSLIINNDEDPAKFPFFINQTFFDKGFVHIFDDTTEIMLDHLDTISDFTDYLEEKQKLFDNKIVFCCGEEDLLAHYLINYEAKTKKHSLKVKGKFNVLSIEEGNYLDVIDLDDFKNKKKADEISYLWDDIIDNFVEHAISGTSYKTNAKNIGDQSTLLSFLAIENRFRRRCLAKSLYEFVGKYPDSKKGFKASRAFDKPDENGILYFFLIFSSEGFKNYNKYREVRGKMLEEHAFIYKHVHQDATHIIGLATEVKNDEGMSEDLIYLDCSENTEELKVNAKSIYDLYVENGIFEKNQKFIKVHEKEFPIKKSQPQKKKKKTGRNDPCPCGSGKKYKKCCMK